MDIGRSNVTGQYPIVHNLQCLPSSLTALGLDINDIRLSVAARIYFHIQDSSALGSEVAV